MVHDVFFLALGDHDDGDNRVDVLYHGQCLESAESWHVFVEDDEVEGFLAAEVDGVLSVGGGDHLIVFFL